MTAQLDPWKVVGVADDLPLPGLWSELSGRPIAGELTEGEDAAELPGVSASLASALDRVYGSVPTGSPSAWTWSQIIRTVPLDPGLDANLSETGAEQALHSGLRFLRQVCDKPRLHLRAEERRESVGRVRRITPRTIQHLAAHSEDWQARTFRGVRPGRLLAQVTEDEWALYENRATVTLQRHLVPALQRRVDDIDALRNQLAAMEQLNDFSRGSRFKRDRLSTLLGRAFTDPPSAESLRQVHSRLREMLAAVRQLGSSELIRKTRGFAQVRPPLRSTNVFREDEAYRHVAGLWREWMEDAAEPPPTVEEMMECRRRRILAHRYIALVLTVRALEEMQMVRQISASTDKRSGPLELQRGWRLRVESTGLVCLEKDAELRAQILPLAIARRHLPTEQLRSVDEAFAIRCDVPLLCVWLDSAEGPASELEPSGHSIRHVSASPQRLDSLEGPLRFLREVIYRAEWPVVPFKITLSVATLAEARQRGLLGNQNGLAHPPDRRAMETLGRDLENAKNEVHVARDEIREIEETLRRVPHSSRVAHSARENRQRIQQRLEAADRRQTQLNSLWEVMSGADSAFKFARQCPCCREKRPADVVSVRFRCVGCRTEWGRNPVSGNVFIQPEGAHPASTGETSWGADLIGAAP